jgi:hypothetical protein
MALGWYSWGTGVGWHVALTVLGAAAELAGLSLVVADALHARKAVRRVVPLYAAPFRVNVTTEADLTVAGQELTVEERVAALEADVPRHYRALDHRINEVHGAAQDAAGRARGEAMSHADDLDREVREFIADSLGSRRSIIGVGFFVGRVIMSALANVV